MRWASGEVETTLSEGRAGSWLTGGGRGVSRAAEVLLSALRELEQL